MAKQGWTRLIGTICDPTRSSAASGRQEIWIHGDQIAIPPPGTLPDVEYGSAESLIMAGGIDPHTHIGGGKVNIARMMLPERKRLDLHRDTALGYGSNPLSSPVPSTIETGRRYLQMGYTTCFEPAVIPVGARQAHLEMADTPWLDCGGYLMLGNEQVLLQLLASQDSKDIVREKVRDYVGWMLQSHQCLAVKVVNPAGVDAWKRGRNGSDIDDVHPTYDGVTPRKVLFALAQAVEDLRLVHPIHVHCNHLGVAGNIETTLETIRAVEGKRIHLTHIQFHAFGKGEPHGFVSAAPRLIDAVNSNPNVSVDIGQVLFGQTVTLSGDVDHQYANRMHAKPQKGFFQEIECQGGCGVVPFRYRQSQYVHSLQWAIGLELFLGIENPWQLFLTTDHPNGAPFTSYPHLIRLLMDYDFRCQCFENLHPDVRSTHPLARMRRQYSLEEIAIITRASPARSLGLERIGSLQANSLADVVVYNRSQSVDSMFANPSMVFRRGKMVYRDGEFLETTSKSIYRANLEGAFAKPKWLDQAWRETYSKRLENAVLSDNEICESCNVELMHASTRSS